ncbi:MAG: SurA N-terminal domain-containing protein [Lentisphaeria bacterium]|nr:SurA N-terminal domain-containing protein [Lentisphaeria bacterium]
MVIKKLNSLFHKHSRVLFGAFTLLIIVAFTDFLTPGRSGGCGGGENTVVGTAFGDKVTYGDLAGFGRSVSVAFLLSGREISLPGNAELFQYYCLIKRAGQLGLDATDAEIAAVIAANPAFRKDGKFDAVAYDQFLKARRLNDREVADALKLRIVEEKLMQMLAANDSVSDAEAEAFYRINNGTYTLKICQFDAGKFSTPAPTEEQIANFYQEHRDRYVAPGSFEAALVSIPYDRFAADAAKEVTAEEVKQAAASGGFVGPDGKPLGAEAVKKQLVQARRSVLANRFAGKVFRDLYKQLGQTEKPEDQLRLFRNWAEKNRLSVAESGKIAFGGDAVGKYHLRRICEELQTMPRQGLQLTRPESDGDAIHIAMLKNRTESRQLTLEEAKAAVVKDRAAEMRLKAARAFAANESSRLAKMDAKAAAAAFDTLKGTFTDAVFPASETEKDPKKTALVYSVAQVLPPLSTGGISAAVDNADGAAIVKVVKRSPADMAKFKDQKPFLKSQLSMLKSQRNYQRFMEDLSRQCRFLAADARAE